MAHRNESTRWRGTGSERERQMRLWELEGIAVHDGYRFVICIRIQIKAVRIYLNNMASTSRLAINNALKRAYKWPPLMERLDG